MTESDGVHVFEFWDRWSEIVRLELERWLIPSSEVQLRNSVAILQSVEPLWMLESTRSRMEYKMEQRWVTNSDKSERKVGLGLEGCWMISMTRCLGPDSLKYMCSN